MDQLWQTLRYFLIGFGGYLVGKGKIAPENVGPLADTIIQILGAIVSIASALWGLYVRFGTKSVPTKDAVRTDVPTVSTATGAVQKG